MKWLFRWIFAVFTLLTLFPGPGTAQAAGFSLIRDEEIERTLRAYATPIFTSAGLDADAVHIYIVNDDSINAFVAGGSNIFIHTGLLLAADTPDMVIGVLAHETGHISGGHLVRGAQAAEQASAGALLSYVLAGVAGVATKSSDVGAAVLTAGNQIAERSLYAYTRTQEEAADQAALSFLDNNHLSAQGMLDMFKKLRMLEKLHMDGQNPYLSTHPLTQDRMVHIRNHVEETESAQTAAPQEFIERHARMLGKLRGFLNRPEETFAAYPKENNSVEAHYARAVAYYKQSDLPNALAEIDDLITQSPSDPYFIELKAQMLYEHGQLAEATVFYRKAVELLPDSALIRTALGASMLGSGKEADTEDAVTQLKKALELEPRYIDAWRQLAGAYNRQKKTGLYHLALAEENYLLGKNEEVTKYSQQAAGELPGNSPSWYRAKDLEMLAENAKKKQP